MDSSRIEAALAGGLTASGLPGAVAAHLGPEGSTAWALGARGGPDGAAMTPDTLFWIASMTKAITTVAALQLVAEGRVELDAPVGRWLPELRDPQVLEGFAADGAPRLRPARTPVTLRTLLAHTSGLAYDFAHPELARWSRSTEAVFLGTDPPSGLPLVFDPGEGWTYGLGIDFAGRLIEAVCGRDLGAELEARIFAPLGMGDTGFRLTEAQSSRTAAMHARGPDGGVQPIPFRMAHPPHFQMGGGGLYSTATDYLKFLGALAGHGAALLPPALMTLVTTPQVTTPRPGVLASVAPHLSNDFDPFPGQPTGWTLGFVTNLEPGPAGRAAGSLAWAGLSNCYYWLDPTNGVAGVLMTQLLPFADPGVLSLFDAFERAVYTA